MGLHLICAAADPSWLVWSASFTINVLKVIVGLGLVIFVHELGHFLVAKLAGVKCEKFYLGFDIFGIKLWRFVAGETEYGVGVLPLGGYVKMLGQEDNPARLREELERAKARQASAGDSSSSAQDLDIAQAERALYDPRSYLAQSVPKRMAIISAGVIMNVLFAGLTAIAAYGLGVFWIPPEIGDVLPGQAAWRAGLRVGDRVEQIAGEPMDRFTELKEAISVGNIDHGLRMVVKRPGVKEPLTLCLSPDRIHYAPTIGISSPSSVELDAQFGPARPFSAAALAKPALEGGDRIVAIDGQPVEEYYEIHRHLALQPDKPLRVTVRRQVAPADRNSEGRNAAVTVEVPPQPVWHLGLVMEMGPVTAIQANSPAAAAGLKPGDVIRRVNNQPVGDPLRLPDRLRSLAARGQRQVILTVARKDQPEATLRATLRQADWYEQPNLLFPGDPVSVPALGVAYQVVNRVAAVEAESPAAKARLKPGTVIVRARLLPPDKQTLKRLDLGSAARLVVTSPTDIEFDIKEPKNWPFFFAAMQMLLPGSRVQLEMEGGGKVILQPAQARAWFNPDRGFHFKGKEFLRRATSLGDAVALGTWETYNSLTLVFRLLGKLGSQVSPKALGGPVSIAVLAYQSASEGLADLLIFLTLIGANLAVLNFLPIPVLDGGHMVFLTYEGIRGKPPSQRVQLALSYLGLIFILGLMIFVLGLDIGRLTGLE